MECQSHISDMHQNVLTFFGSAFITVLVSAKILMNFTGQRFIFWLLTLFKIKIRSSITTVVNNVEIT